MSDIKLFDIRQGKITELSSSSVELEKSLQTLIENNLEALLGVKFLATEYTTGSRQRGRIDTLGIDENGCPVIIEYKRSLNENVINQGLYYLDWLLDHKSDFRLLVMEKLDKQKADQIEWASPRLICIASDFNKYDEHAVQQIPRNIELIRYRKYSDGFLLLELVNVTTPYDATESSIRDTGKIQKNKYQTASGYLQKASQELKDRYENLRSFMLALGDDVQEKACKNYFAYKRIKNFACADVHPQSNLILVYLKLNPDAIDLVSLGHDFARDVRNIGHFGTGDLELRLRDAQDFEKAKPMIVESYEVS
jgi:predicted transport protein